MTNWRALVRDLARELREVHDRADGHCDGQCEIAALIDRADEAVAIVRPKRPETRENAKRHNRPVSEKARAYDREFRAASDRVRVRSRGLCEARIGVVCTGFAEHVHHRRRRSQGGGNESENLMAVCLPCHGHIHANPAWAAERGWLVMSKVAGG